MLGGYMTDIDNLIEKAQRQISATEGVLEALGGNLKRSYAYVADQLTHNPADPHLRKQLNDLNGLIENFSAIVEKALLTVGVSDISQQDVIRAVKQM